MREELRTGYNIIYGTGDTITRAVSEMETVMREAYENFYVETIGGLNVRDDHVKNKFHVMREVYLIKEDSPATGPGPVELVPEDFNLDLPEEVDDGTL